VQRRSLLGGYPGHDALLLFFCDFSKNYDNSVATDCTSERFFDGNSILREVRVMACVGRAVAARSKLLAPTPPRIRCEDLRAQLESSGLRPTSFQKHLSDRPNFSLKQLLRQNHARLPLEPPELSGAANEWLLSAGQEGRPSSLLCLCGS
jgi:hypothetical protein